MSDKTIIRSSHKDRRNFTELPDLRKGVIEEAPATPLRANYAVNSLANLLHPKKQFLKVKQLAEISSDVYIYVLEPDPSLGTVKPAFFRAGQELEITPSVDNVELKNNYTICSSPKRALENEYVIIVNSTDENPASEYIIKNWKTGTKLTASAPQGLYYHQTIRDCNYVVAICDNTGYEPFLSMAEAVNDGTLKINLTLIYSARKLSDITMAERFEELSKAKLFTFIPVLSDERIIKYERGFITKSLIDKYAPTNKYSLFISGSPEFRKRIAPQIAEIGLESKLIKYR